MIPASVHANAAKFYIDGSWVQPLAAHSCAVDEHAARAAEIGEHVAVLLAMNRTVLPIGGGIVEDQLVCWRAPNTQLFAAQCEGLARRGAIQYDQIGMWIHGKAVSYFTLNVTRRSALASERVIDGVSV